MYIAAEMMVSCERLLVCSWLGDVPVFPCLSDSKNYSKISKGLGVHQLQNPQHYCPLLVSGFHAQTLRYSGIVNIIRCIIVLLFGTSARSWAKQMDLSPKRRLC